jgi:hypothetical protein
MYALITTIDTSRTIFTKSDDGFTESLVDCPVGTVMNIIVYDGVSPYTVPTNMQLKQVADTVKIGDVVSL